MRPAICALYAAVAILMTGCGGPPAAQSGGPSRCPTETATGCAHGEGSPAACSNPGSVSITASPIDLAEIAFIVPMGTMIGAHVTPIDHGYFYVKGSMASPTYQVAVKAPLAGTITTASRTVRQGPNGSYDDYALSIDATCGFRVRFSNLVRFAGGFGDAIGSLQPGQQATPGFKVQAGELIGYTGLPTAYGIDVWVENDRSTLTGFIHPDQYTAAEAWKTHVVDLFQYTVEPLRSQLLALDLREASPRWGRIDYDVEGRLVGNWFKVGTGGYGGLQHMREGYWRGHLAAVYDGIDPSAVELSFGDFAGQAVQFSVAGNGPDPAAVTLESGPVKYELVRTDYYSAVTGSSWDHTHYMAALRVRPETHVEGTVLMQLMGPEQLKVETFPNQTASQVTGFDGSAQTYER